MILSCPACDARFSVPDTALGKYGRKLRCSKCRHEWFQASPDVAAALSQQGLTSSGPDFDKLLREGSVSASDKPAAASATSTSAGKGKKSARDRAKDAKPKKNKRTPFAALSQLPIRSIAASILLLGIAGVLGVLNFMPSLINDAVPSTGLSMQDVTMRRTAITPSGDRYLVEGDIINTTEQAIKLPLLRIVLLDKNGFEYRRWHYLQQEHKEIAPGASMHFTAEGLEAPVLEGGRLRLDLGSKLELALRKPQ